MKKLITLALVFMLIGGAAFAQPRKADRFHKFKIEQGFRKGDFNRLESKQL